DLVEILEGIKKGLGTRMNDEDISLACHDLRPVRGYKELIVLLFNHLVDNAIKFRKENGHLEIRIACTRVDGVSVQHPEAIPGARYEVVEIRDNVAGFEEQFAPRIFDMFYRIHEKNKYKGSGIGLTICKKIMDIHGGFITVQSIPGDGSAFSCYFP